MTVVPELASGTQNYRTQYSASDGWNIALGHRRLSILDCSQNGHQPMLDKSGRYIIAFNGEIYNFSEIKERNGRIHRILYIKGRR